MLQSTVSLYNNHCSDCIRYWFSCFKGICLIFVLTQYRRGFRYLERGFLAVGMSEAGGGGHKWGKIIQVLYLQEVGPCWCEPEFDLLGGSGQIALLWKPTPVSGTLSCHVTSILIGCCYRPYDAKNPYLAPVQVNRELHRGGDRSCMHIEFDISDAKMR